VNAFERYFYAPHGAARSFLFAKVFPLMLALDTWLLMIGHAGRYGVAGFNVAHFAWLDALLPMPQAGFYVGVLVLTGLLALVVALTGVRRSTGLLLFALYTLSWSMSMLDSYQHHYLLSVLLLCLAFFPSTSAEELHAQARTVAVDAPRHKHQAQRALEHAERSERAEQRGWMYATAVLIACAAYAVYLRGEDEQHTWLAFFAFAGTVATATTLYVPERRAPLLREGFGFNLLGASVCIVYLYTATAKMDANWFSGSTLLRISSVEREFSGLADLGAMFGIAREHFWGVFATMVIPQELFVGCVYLIAVRQDGARSRLVRVLCWVAFVLSIALHVGAEAMGLDIGWFSGYMLLLASCFLLPLAVVERLCTAFSWPARLLARQAGDFGSDPHPLLGPSLALALAGAGLLVMVGKLIDLPGAVPACSIAALALIAVALASVHRQRDPRRHIAATVIAAAVMWGAIASSSVRWDFYRYLGGDLARRDEPEAALEAYVRGERYAPPGQSRGDKIKKIRAQLGR
jgi:hypothetical protein